MRRAATQPPSHSVGTRRFSSQGQGRQAGNQGLDDSGKRYIERPNGASLSLVGMQ